MMELLEAKTGTIKAADLFCGAGGFSSGLLAAIRAAGLDVDLVAVNHWDVAIATYSANHPGVKHLCETLDNVDPRKVVPGGYLDLLLASPECTHHSNARGGKPMSDQSRASAWHILRWAEALYIREIIIENVREFRDWGPLDKDARPVKKRKGVLYKQFLSSLRALGYTVDDRILNAADYGDATSRKRLFIRASREQRRITWPVPTHLPAGSLELRAEQLTHRTAREIIDWELPGKSIYDRKRPLSPNTMRRIMAGLKKYSGLPFVVPNFGERDGQEPRTHSVDAPIPTVTGHGAGCLVQPFIVPLEHGGANTGDRAHEVDKPLPTVTAKGQFGLCEPFLVQYYGGQDAVPVDKPLPTICANYEHYGLCEPFLVEYHGNHAGRADGDERARSVDQPLGTLDTSNRFALAQPYLVVLRNNQDAKSIDEPVPTLCASGSHFGVCEPFLVKYHGNGGARPVDAPLDTITSRDRFGLVTPEIGEDAGEVAMLDIRFRMLQPHELSAAMSFPSDYEFAGNRDAKVRQIGNAVPVRLAAALCGSALSLSASARLREAAG